MICTSESVQTPRLCFQIITKKPVVIFFKSGAQGVVHTQISLTKWDAHIPTLNANVQRSV